MLHIHRVRSIANLLRCFTLLCVYHPSILPIFENDTDVYDTCSQLDALLLVTDHIIAATVFTWGMPTAANDAVLKNLSL